MNVRLRAHQNLSLPQTALGSMKSPAVSEMPSPLAERRPDKMSITFFLDSNSSLNSSSLRPVAGGGSQSLTQSIQTNVATGAPHFLSNVPSPGSDRSSKGELRGSRASRPSYSEEQRFYIMYLRIVCSKSWDEIADVFAKAYGGDSAQRSKGGLTSVYYRIRKSWGLKDVLDAQPGETLTEDVQAVEERASNFSRDFLLAIRYLQ